MNSKLFELLQKHSQEISTTALAELLHLCSRDGLTTKEWSQTNELMAHVTQFAKAKNMNALVGMAACVHLICQFEAQLLESINSEAVWVKRNLKMMLDTIYGRAQEGRLVLHVVSDLSQETPSLATLEITGRDTKKDLTLLRFMAAHEVVGVAYTVVAPVIDNNMSSETEILFPSDEKADRIFPQDVVDDLATAALEVCGYHPAGRSKRVYTHPPDGQNPPETIH